MTKDNLKEYLKQHKGKVTNVTNYSFTFETLSDKNGKTEKTVVMESYFYKKQVL
jgi:hypothetical protein